MVLNLCLHLHCSRLETDIYVMKQNHELLMSYATSYAAIVTVLLGLVVQISNREQVIA